MLGQWTLELEEWRDFSTKLKFRDEGLNLINLAGWIIKFNITHDTGVIEWSVASGHVTISVPSTNGEATLAVTKTTILTLPFDWADFDFFAGATANTLQLIYRAKARRLRS